MAHWNTAVTALLERINSTGKSLVGANAENARLELIETASRLITELENPMEQCARYFWGEPSRSAALQTAFELGIFAKLNAKTPLTSKELAEGTSAEPLLIARVMKNLAAYNIVKEAGRDQYLATPFTLATANPAMHGCIIYSFDAMVPTFASMSKYLAKTKYQNPSDGQKPPMTYGLNTDMNLFGYLKAKPEIGSAFNNFMAGYAQNRPRWTDSYSCTELSTTEESNKPLIVDVGGGLGHCLIDFLAKCPEAKGTLVIQDQAQVIEEVKTTDLPAQIKPMVHDFLQPQPAECRGAKAYFMRQIMHDWSDDTCVTILAHLRDAMDPTSKVLLNEHVISNVGASWQATSLDWTMMAMLSSLERTEEQWHTLLGRAGLKITGIYQKVANSEAVIEAVLASN